MSDSKAPKRFALPKVLAVTLLSCGPAGPRVQLADGGSVDCSNVNIDSTFNCACCNLTCNNECSVPGGTAGSQCTCLV
jgi:hypothetical protein